MSQFQIRTDLALETREKFEENQVEIKGVRIEEEIIGEDEMKITNVVIETENGAKAMGKPKGSYVTIEAKDMSEQDDGYHRNISVQLARKLKELLPEKESRMSVLVVGLGNREVTPDSLGPRVIDNMMVTRHILREYGTYAFGKINMNSISSIVPGVMGQTGMESQEIIKGIIRETKPDCIIVIDALAARSTKRLCRTIQLTDTGICPGSGVGNHRHGLNKETLGVPVIAIGIPMVVDAPTIVNDALETLLTAMQESKEQKELENKLEYEMIRELLSPNLNIMYVTPKDIDESVKRLSFTVSEGLNIALTE